MELGMPWSVGSMAEQTKRLEQGGSPRTSGHRRYCDFVQYRYADIGAAAPREVRAGGRDKSTGADEEREGTGRRSSRHVDKCEQSGVSAAVSRGVRAGGRDEPTEHWSNLRRRRAQASHVDIAPTFICGDLEQPGDQRTQRELCGETLPPTAKVFRSVLGL